ncbi:high mobility group nucleosome-binding domain-containing protein 5-like isoform X2 [Gouania willdenowi]|uniref:high mobility group nucleosome-binding domain-containing protein 5-like isoform X2 n=1 Tax=Gouania willdenowi TaxID=441366 RepID=UPI001055B765|nr:high mobility group nucleosome-binding domain-containing protein 5-like isoform X2 [Gouania willdenowi]
MPTCAAFGCSKRTVLFCFPKESHRRRAWINAVGRTSLPKNPRLCSAHFEACCLDDSTRLQCELLGSRKRRNQLKPDAIPTIFPYKTPRQLRHSSVRSSERKRQQTQDDLLSNPGPSNPKEEPKHDEPVLIDKRDLPGTLIQTTQEVATQTEWPESRVATCDAECQFPLDIVLEVLLDHPYVKRESPDGQGNLEEPMEILFSQGTTSSSSNYYPSLISSPYSFQESLKLNKNPDTHKERLFLVYEERLKELLRFCIKCGSPMIKQNTIEKEANLALLEEEREKAGQQVIKEEEREKAGQQAKKEEVEEELKISVKQEEPEGDEPSEENIDVDPQNESIKEEREDEPSADVEEEERVKEEESYDEKKIKEEEEEEALTKVESDPPLEPEEGTPVDEEPIEEPTGTEQEDKVQPENDNTVPAKIEETEQPDEDNEEDNS